MNRKPVIARSIKADAQGNAPDSIELLRVGIWHTPWHGDFAITTDDLHEFVANFGNGVGLVDADARAPINYAHESWDKAAAWISRLRVSDDGQALLGEGIEWTPRAAEALKDGEWKYISPEFNPRGCPWEDPEEEFSFVNNVLTGAGLTNIPLFKKLKPIMASRVPPGGVTADQGGASNKRNQGDNMTLEELRAKEVKDLTAEEKQFLADHKDELNSDEIAALGLGEQETEAPETQAPTPAETEAPTSVNASVDARMRKLEADAKAARDEAAQLRREADERDARDFVTQRVEAGQIKSEQFDATVKLILASTGDARTQAKALLEGLPTNDKINASERGSGASKGAVSATTQVFEKAGDLVKADSKLGHRDAVLQVLKSDQELAKQFKEEGGQ
ncbi:phage protease [Tsukamurella spumae]|uniref:Uncharacterized protein n=1 Tax=Tsukamurella spumae TaxID=44753 RepID=A0A846X021_9ACTN|nr:phage protease [Tsukamurella spumae]NKY18867.1 hypothetical protein [Tsukamurella spumae]